VTDVDPPSGPEAGDSSGGLASALNSTPKVIGAITSLIVAVSGLLIALNKTGILGGGGSSGAVTTIAGRTLERGETVEDVDGIDLFKAEKSPHGRVYFKGKTMYVDVDKPNAPMVLRADQSEPLQHVSMSTRAHWISGAADYGFALFCRYTNPKNYYFIGVLSGGRYSIGRYRNGKLTFLKRGFKSPYIEERDNDVKVSCVGTNPTTLSLDVNGKPIAQVTDPTGLPAGNVGLRVGTGRSYVTTSFEDFVLEHL